MRKFALALAVLASLGATGAMAATSATPAAAPAAAAAAPAPMTATGLITAISTKYHTFTINKVVYHVASKFDLSKFKVGQNVTVTYSVVKKQDWASKLVAA